MSPLKKDLRPQTKIILNFKRESCVAVLYLRDVVEEDKQFALKLYPTFA